MTFIWFLFTLLKFQNFFPNSISVLECDFEYWETSLIHIERIVNYRAGRITVKNSWDANVLLRPTRCQHSLSPWLSHSGYWVVRCVLYTHFVTCTLSHPVTNCTKESTISHDRLNDIVKRSKTSNHSKSTSSRAARNITSYFSAPGTSTYSRDLDDIMYKTSAAEITSTYHTVKHSLSDNSIDWFQKLLPLMYADSEIAKNVKCGKTNNGAIICEVLAKEALKEAI